MPKNNIDYTNTIIYKIQHKEKSELVYIGHTTNFDSRQSQHKKSANKHDKTPLYNMICEFGGWTAFTMSPIKQVSCKNRIDALIEEQKAIDENKASLNYNIAHKSTAKSNLKNNREEYNKIQTAQKQQLKQKQDQAMRLMIEREIEFMNKNN